jgi:serine/threonine protein kinase/Leucine-rich repeat (LRR) protein
MRRQQVRILLLGSDCELLQRIFHQHRRLYCRSNDAGSVHSVDVVLLTLADLLSDILGITVAECSQLLADPEQKLQLHHLNEHPRMQQLSLVWICSRENAFQTSWRMYEAVLQMFGPPHGVVTSDAPNVVGRLPFVIVETNPQPPAATTPSATSSALVDFAHAKRAAGCTQLSSIHEGVESPNPQLRLLTQQRCVYIAQIAEEARRLQVGEADASEEEEKKGGEQPVSVPASSAAPAPCIFSELDDFQLRHVCVGLTAASAASSLTIFSSWMTDRGVSTLAATLQTLSRSQHLHLHTINLTRALSCAITTYNRLIQSLVGLPLKSLVIAGNNIDPSSDDASARAELGRTHQHLLEATPSLVHLHLTTLPASVDAVRSIVQIQHLDLSGAVSGITDDAARSAFHASLLSLWRDPTSPIRAKGSRLQHLSLANNQLTGDAISDLLNHLADHPHLTALDLSKNHLTNSAEMVEGLTVLLHSLTSRLRALDLSSNLLAEFSPVLYEKPLRLQQLLLRGNPITNLPQYLLNSTTSAQLLHHLALMGRAAVSSSSSSIAPPPPRRLRLLLLGNGCAGKTFLKDRLLLLPRDHPPSDISEWTVDQAVDWIREKGYEEEVVYHLRKKSFNGRNLDERDVDSLEENIRVLLAGDEDLQQAVERLIADVKALQEQADQNMASGATLYTSTVGILTDSFTHSFYDASSGRRIEVIVDVLDFAGQQEYFMSHSLFMTDVQAVYVLVNNLTKKETAKEASSAASLRHVVNAEYESQIHFWLSFLQSLFPSSAAVDVTVVQTHLDQLHRISDTKKQPNPTKLRESLRTRHGSVFGQLEVLQLDYSEQDASAATSSASVRASLLQRIESKAVRIASPYDGVEHTLAQWITTVRASGKLPVVTTKDVMVRLRDVVRSLSHPAASLDATLEAAMAHLTVAGLLLPIAAMGVVILEPLQWFAHCIAAFVSGNSGDEAHRGSSPGGIRSENGIIEWHSIVPHAAQLLCTGEKKEEQLKLLMSLLVHFGLCYPLHQGKELPRYLFPCLLPAHPHQHEEIRRFMRCDEVEVDYNQQIQLNHFARQQHIEAKYLQPSAAASSASASSSSSASAFDYPRFVERGPSRFIFSVVGRDWSCKSSAQGDVAVDLPPTLFPQLQMACLRHFGATCTQYGQGFICIQTRFERGFIHLIPSQRCIRTVVGGHAPQVLLGEMVEVVETSLLPVASLEQSMQRYSLCRFCLGMLCFPQRQTGASPPELLEQVSGVQDEAGCTYKQFCVSVDRFDLASEASHRCSVSGLPQHTAASPRSASEAEATIDPIRSAFYREDTQSLFLLSQSYVTELSVEAAANFSVQAGPQELFSNGARSIPAHYDASLALDDGTVVFFRGSSYWRSSTDFSHLLDEDVPCAFLEPSAYYPRPMSDTVTSTAWRDDIHPCLVKAAASGKDGGTTDEIQSLQASSDLDTRLFALPSSVFVEALNTSQVDGQSSSVVFGTIDLTRCSSALVNLWKSHATLSHLIDFSRSPSDVEVAAKVLRKSHASMTRQQLLQDCIDEIETNLRLFAHPHAHLLPMLGYSIELAREGRAEAEANTIEDLVALAHLLDEEQMDEVRVTLIFPRLPQSLESLVTSHPLPLSSANNLDAITSILAQAAEAVHHCHELGLVHRDLSSRSFLFDPARRVFLSDFRQARFLAKRNRSLGASEQSGASSSFGQASFSDAIKTARSAPESFTHRVYSRQTDVFQFGRFMAEILAVWPREFVATRATHAENMEADSVVHGISANVQVESHRWPRALCDLVTACCYSHPDHRPTIKEVHQQLRSFPISLSHSAASSHPLRPC